MKPGAIHLPIKGQKQLVASRVRVREAYARAEDEYSDPEFQELLASIKETGGNLDPIDVRMLDGVPGYDAELLAGTRRLRACKELGLFVLANVRECDERMADRIHETENKHRKNKSIYSRARTYQSLMASGRYESLTDMAGSLGTRLLEVSEAVSLLEKAPAGMWAKVTNPGAFRTTHLRTLMAAYDKKEFQDAVGKADSLDVAALISVAQQALKPPRARRGDAGPRLAKRGKGFVVVLPEGLSEAAAKTAFEAVQKALSAAAKGGYP